MLEAPDLPNLFVTLRQGNRREERKRRGWGKGRGLGRKEETGTRKIAMTVIWISPVQVSGHHLSRSGCEIPAQAQRRADRGRHLGGLPRTLLPGDDLCGMGESVSGSTSEPEYSRSSIATSTLCSGAIIQRSIECWAAPQRKPGKIPCRFFVSSSSCLLSVSPTPFLHSGGEPY